MVKKPVEGHRRVRELNDESVQDDVFLLVEIACTCAIEFLPGEMRDWV